MSNSKALPYRNALGTLKNLSLLGLSICISNYVHIFIKSISAPVEDNRSCATDFVGEFIPFW